MSDGYVDGVPSGDEALDFEFERKFFVAELPDDVARHGSRKVIVQAYLFAVDGYAVRVRVTIQGCVAELVPFDDAVDFVGAYERRQLDALLKAVDVDDVVAATIAVKSPGGTGDRYEMESELDTDVAVQILRRSPRIILKTRYSLWYDEDGWEFDVFRGQNEGLIVAECERLAPVVSLKIPDFCVTEVTDDLRFSNDYLSKEPWKQWSTQFLGELAMRGPRFLDLE